VCLLAVDVLFGSGGTPRTDDTYAFASLRVYNGQKTPCIGEAYDQEIASPVTEWMVMNVFEHGDGLVEGNAVDAKISCCLGVIPFEVANKNRRHTEKYRTGSICCPVPSACSPAPQTPDERPSVVKSLLHGP